MGVDVDKEREEEKAVVEKKRHDEQRVKERMVSKEA